MSKKTISIPFKVDVIKEGKFYCLNNKKLNICGYGYTMSEAKNSFNIMLKLLIDDLLLLEKKHKKQSKKKSRKK